MIALSGSSVSIRNFGSLELKINRVIEVRLGTKIYIYFVLFKAINNHTANTYSGKTVEVQ